MIKYLKTNSYYAIVLVTQKWLHEHRFKLRVNHKWLTYTQFILGTHKWLTFIQLNHLWLISVNHLWLSASAQSFMIISFSTIIYDYQFQRNHLWLSASAQSLMINQRESFMIISLNHLWLSAWITYDYQLESLMIVSFNVI